jgi:uncharacterized membrane protein YobD (UPF0266 family)
LCGSITKAPLIKSTAQKPECLIQGKADAMILSGLAGFLIWSTSFSKNSSLQRNVNIVAQREGVVKGFCAE